MAMTVKYSLTAEDVLASQGEAMRLFPTFESDRMMYRRRVAGWCLVLLAFSGAFMWASHLMRGNASGHWSGLYGALAAGVLLSAIVIWVASSYARALREVLQRHAMSGALDLVAGAYEMTCDEKGLRVVGPWSESWMDWKLVHGVTRGERFVIVMKRDGSYYAVPLGAVEGEFVGRVEGWRRG